VQANSRQTGFTLIEISIVLLVVSILLGYTIAFLPVQQELKQYRQVDDEMDRIINELIAFAQVNGRLPCPDADGDGEADFNLGPPRVCTANIGNVPSRTMGMYGDLNDNGVIIDPWGRRYLYSVTASDFSGDNADFTTAGEMRNESIPNLAPDIDICNVQPAAHTAATPNNDPGCDAVAQEVVTDVVAVLISQGKDQGGVVSDIQSENIDNDVVFVSTTRNDTVGAEYDDVVKWISPNRLYSKMIEADQLP
jgi:prepilin-type N-terminal cleavage/methylation domain-containing protein